MQFAETWQWILGTSPATGLPKTQTRRVARSYAVPGRTNGEITDVWDFDGQRVYAPIYEVSKTYAVQPGRGQKAMGRIRIEQIQYCPRAATISEDDARAEGFLTADEFRAAYTKINGPEALDRPCWILSFALEESHEPE